MAPRGRDGTGCPDVITADKNIRHQQNLAGRSIALIVPSTNDSPSVSAQLERVMDAVEAVVVGGYQEVALERPPLRRRPFNRPD
jgi:hypothetical protein